MNASSKKIAQIAMLSIGLAAGNGAWSCQNGVQNKPPADADVDKTQSLSASDLYKLFHDPRLNKPDGLGDYA